MNDKQKVVMKLLDIHNCPTCNEPLTYRGRGYGAYVFYHCLKCKSGWEWCENERQRTSSS